MGNYNVFKVFCFFEVFWILFKLVVRESNYLGNLFCSKGSSSFVIMVLRIWKDL